jgi:hypothetical protein
MLGITGVDAVRWGWPMGMFCPVFRCGGGGAAMPFGAPRFMAATSIDCERWSSVLMGGSDLGGSSRPLPQCCASSDRLSSIGVKILCALAAAGRGFG